MSRKVFHTCFIATLFTCCFLHQSLCDVFKPTAENLEQWGKYQRFAAIVTNLVMPTALNKKGGDLVSIPDDLEKDYLLIPTDTACSADLNRTLESPFEKWAIKMLDADAKPPSGMMEMNLNWFGDYYECQSVEAPATVNSSGFSGRYCNFELMLELPTTNLSVKAGMCVPSSCGINEFNNLTNILHLVGRFPVKNFTISYKVKVNSCATKEPLDASAIGMLFLLGTFILLTGAGTAGTIADKWREKMKARTISESHVVCYTILEDCKNDSRSIQEREVVPTEESMMRKLLKCFCILTNGAKILSTDAKGDLSCVHGIRFLSMTWVILGHTYAFALTVMLMAGNMRQLMDEIDKFPFQAILQGTFSVDSFFLLSGFLLSYLFLKEAVTKDGKIPWAFFYIHRYLRLTPVYAVVLGFNTALTVYVSEGPLWPVGSSDPNCRTSWWWNLLYINNFQETAQQCMGWSWYLANDMQFYVISPIFLYLLWRWPKAGLSFISCLMVCSWIATGVISYNYNLIPGYAGLTAYDTQTILTKMPVYFEKLYIKPYTRIGPYLIGVILGYAVWEHINHRKPLSKVVLVVGWTLSIFGGLGVVYGFYHSHPDEVVSALINSLNRSIFSASLAWLIYACLCGCGGPINAILSWKFLVPLSRLTYCAYLVHPIILLSFYQSLRTPVQTANSYMVMLFLGFLVMSYGTALICSLVFESSLMALEKLGMSYFKKFKKN